VHVSVAAWISFGTPINIGNTPSAIDADQRAQSRHPAREPGVFGR